MCRMFIQEIMKIITTIKSLKSRGYNLVWSQLPVGKIKYHRYQGDLVKEMLTWFDLAKQII